MVVIGYDGSERAREAIAAAGRALDGGPARVVHVAFHVPPPATATVIPGAPAPSEEDRRAQESREAQRVLEEGVEHARRAGFDADGRVEEGAKSDDIWLALIATAEALDARLIVAGRRGLGAVGAALLGSVTKGLLENSAVPVLIVPSG